MDLPPSGYTDNKKRHERSVSRSPRRYEDTRQTMLKVNNEPRGRRISTHSKNSSNSRRDRSPSQGTTQQLIQKIDYKDAQIVALETEVKGLQKLVNNFESRNFSESSLYQAMIEDYKQSKVEWAEERKKLHEKIDSMFNILSKKDEEISLKNEKIAELSKLVHSLERKSDAQTHKQLIEENKALGGSHTFGYPHVKPQAPPTAYVSMAHSDFHKFVPISEEKKHAHSLREEDDLGFRHNNINVDPVYIVSEQDSILEPLRLLDREQEEQLQKEIRKLKEENLKLRQINQKGPEPNPYITKNIKDYHNATLPVVMTNGRNSHKHNDESVDWEI